MRHAVILAGGSGERFWPLSRKDRPKQFLPLAGGVSLLRATFQRLAPVIPPERIWVVTAEAMGRRVSRELPELSRANILQEPTPRNTAPALYLAALAVLRKDPDPTLLNVPADAWVPKVKEYRKALRDAMTLARSGGQLVLVGIHPTRAETGYGYIEPGKVLGRGPGRKVRRFVEKPSTPVAARLVAGGRHLWNCGIFAWEARVFSEAVAQHLPRLERAFRPLEAGRWTKGGLEAAYAKAPRISVDYGVPEPPRRRRRGDSRSPPGSP